MSENLRIWNAGWSKTDPAFTKKVEYGARRFTTINAYYQFSKATELFGPVGIGWGWNEPKFEMQTVLDNPVLHLTLTVWYVDPRSSDKDKRYSITTQNAIEAFERKRTGEILYDDDVYKKLLTDTITKSLSYLGCSSDVFMGMYDDNRYVSKMQREYEKQKAEPEQEQAQQERESEPKKRPIHPDDFSEKEPPREPKPDPAKEKSAAEKMAAWKELVKNASDLGVTENAVKEYMKAKHGGYAQVSEMTLKMLSAQAKARRAAYKVLEAAATAKHGDAANEWVSTWLDKGNVDMLEVEPKVIMDAVAHLTGAE